MDKLEEKIESLEQVIEALIGRFRNVEIVVGSLAENEPKDYGDTLQSIVALLRCTEQMASFKELKSLLEHLREKIEANSKKLEIRHYHHFDIKSRSRLWWLFAIFFTVSISFGSAVSLLIRNHQLSTDAEKHKVFRAFYPRQAKQLEEAFHNNSEGLLAVADSLLQLPEPKKRGIKNSPDTCRHIRHTSVRPSFCCYYRGKCVFLIEASLCISITINNFLMPSWT